MIEVSNLTFQYPHQDQPVLQGLSLTIPTGQWLAVVGKNGSGKSTLARLIAGLLPTPAQTIRVNDLPVDEAHLAALHHQIGFVFQNPDNQFVGATVEADVAFGLENRQVPAAAMEPRIEHALAQVGMTAYRHHQPEQLSGGQKQRVAIAGALALQPQILILDEATSMLDPQGRQTVLQRLQQIHQAQALTIISITHDPVEVAMADQVAVLDQGQILRLATPAVVLNDQALVQQVGLVQPFSMQLRDRLQHYGVPVPKEYLTKGALEQWLKRQLATKA